MYFVHCNDKRLDGRLDVRGNRCRRLALFLTTVSAQGTRERSQIRDDRCKQHHGQRQGKRRKLRRGRPADGVEHQISSRKELKKEQEPNVKRDGRLGSRSAPPRYLGDK